MKPLRFAIVTLFCLTINFSLAQKTIETQSLVWLGYNLKFKFNKKWSANHILEQRVYWFPWRQHQLINTNKINYNLGEGFSTSAAITFFQLTLPQSATANSINHIWEIRPHIEVNYSNTISKKWQLQNRGIFEWRYFQNNEDLFAFRNYRYRHRLQFGYRLNNKWSFRAYNEIIINIGKRIINNTFDQNRLGLASKYYFNSSLALEAAYINWYQQQATGNTFFNRNIIQFTFSKVFDFSSKATN